MGVSDEMVLHVDACKAHLNAFISSLLWLGVKDCNENLHEGGHWCCQQNGIGFRLEHAQRAYLRLNHARMHLFAVYGGQK